MRIGEAVRKRIIALCEENKITVNMLATISGVPQSTLNNIVSESWYHSFYTSKAL